MFVCTYSLCTCIALPYFSRKKKLIFKCTTFFPALPSQTFTFLLVISPRLQFSSAGEKKKKTWEKSVCQEEDKFESFYGKNILISYISLDGV